MAIVQSINSVYQFEAAFKYAGRADQFSWNALKALFECLEQYSEESEQDVELDVIALCCDYSEEHYKNIASNYGIDLADADGDTEEEISIVLEYLEENDILICECDAGDILYQVV